MLAVMAGLLYFFAGMRYRNTFFPNTEIGGIDASGKTVDQVKAEIRGRCSRYVLTLAERGGGEEQICGDEIDLHPVFDGTLERILEGQKFWCWGFWAARGRSYPAGGHGGAGPGKIAGCGQGAFLYGTGADYRAKGRVPGL